MKIEILTTNGIKSAYKELDIQASRTYKSTEDPHFEVWEIDKQDLGKLENAIEWPKGWGSWAYSKGSRMGSACDFFTINNEFLIGWHAESGHDTYDKLTDYLYEGLGAKTHEDICSMAVDLARVNGKTMSELFKIYER